MSSLHFFNDCFGYSVENRLEGMRMNHLELSMIANSWLQHTCLRFASTVLGEPY